MYKESKDLNAISFSFSSRRRHTIYWRDWSSDVCSSDLPVRDLLLAGPRRAREEVRDRVRIGGDEVQRALRELLLEQRLAHGPPPAPRHPRVADGAAAQHPHPQVLPALRHVGEALGEALAPRLPHAPPVLLRAAQRLGALGRR